MTSTVPSYLFRWKSIHKFARSSKLIAVRKRLDERSEQANRRQSPSTVDMQSKRRRICLFGTSGDPPTANGGHETIVQELSSLIIPPSQEPYFDQVWVLPVYQHMYSNKRQKQSCFHHRLEMCRLAFGNIPRVVVSNLEQVCYDKYRNETSNTSGFGTVDLLEKLIQQEPEIDFSLALGADTFMDLTSGKWKRSSDILSMIQGRIVVFQRLVVDAFLLHSDVKHNTIVSDQDLMKRIQQVKDSLLMVQQREWELNKDHVEHETAFPYWFRISNLSGVSSSMVRSPDQKESLAMLVSSQVLSYVKQHDLYSHN